jgi:holin-like protein
MTFINGLTILLFYQLVGEISVRWLGLPVPGPVLGMIMLFITLVIYGRIKFGGDCTVFRGQY